MTRTPVEIFKRPRVVLQVMTIGGKTFKNKTRRLQ